MRGLSHPINVVNFAGDKHGYKLGHVFTIVACEATATREGGLARLSRGRQLRGTPRALYVILRASLSPTVICCKPNPAAGGAARCRVVVRHSA